jgi:hypothetical protein
VRRMAVAVSAVTVGLALACTIDRVVGENVTTDGGPDGGPDGGTDAGTPVCPGTASDACQPICGTQTCHAGCIALSDCIIDCTGTSCSFTCERNSQSCSPTTCEPGPCWMDCADAGEAIHCNMNCNPAQTCKAGCHDGQCTVACGDLSPATSCDAGVYSCSGTCPP